MAIVKIIEQKKTTTPTTAWLPPVITELLEDTSKELKVSKSEIIRLACYKLYSIPPEDFTNKIVNYFTKSNKNA